MARAPKESFSLVSSAGSGYFYTNRKNKKKSKGEKKLKVRKYDPKLRQHVVFEDKKLSKLKSKFDREKVIQAVEAAKNAA